MYDESLTHFGVKGMKWGVRKSPKPKPEFMKNRQNGASSGKPNKYSGRSPKPVSNMTASELKARIERLKLEKQYNDLVGQTYPAGNKTVKKYLNEPLAKAVSKSIETFLVAAIGAAVTKPLTKAAVNGLGSTMKNAKR